MNVFACHICLFFPPSPQLLDFLERHPCAFIPLIQRSLEFAVSYVFTPAGEGVTFERFIVQCMNLIKMILKNDAYKPSKNIDGRDATLFKDKATKRSSRRGIRVAEKGNQTHIVARLLVANHRRRCENRRAENHRRHRTQAAAHVYFKLCEACSASLSVEHGARSLFCQRLMSPIFEGLSI